MVSLLLVLLLVLAQTAPAMAREPEVLQAGLQHTAEGLRLSARLGPVATPVVRDALLKGVPMYFVWQADLYRSRWYWTDKRVASVARSYRLTWQPLTQRWRLSLALEGAPGTTGSGLPYALHQSYNTLEEALAVLGRVSAWRIADAAQIDEDESYRVEWRFRLDVSQLPRPMQIGLVNQTDWSIEVVRRMAVPARSATEPVAIERPPAEPADSDR